MSSTNIADLLERILDKGIVIAGDVKISLLDIELLTIQLRLVVCSIDKAQEMGMDWWANNPIFTGKKPEDEKQSELEARLETIEDSIKAIAASVQQPNAAPLPPASPSTPVPAEEGRRFKPVDQPPPAA